MSFKEKFRESIGASELVHYMFRTLFDIRRRIYERPKHELIKYVKEYIATAKALTVLLPDPLLPSNSKLENVGDVDSFIKSLANLLYEKGLYLRMKRVPVSYEVYEEEL